VVTDSECDAPPTLDSGDTGNDGVLPGDGSETWVYSCSTANVQAGFNNIANVTAEEVGTDIEVSDFDTAVVTISAPGIEIIKTPDQNVNPGGTATFTLIVSNVGDTDLDAVVVTDALCDAAPVLESGDTGNDGILPADGSENWVYSCSTTNVLAGFTNTGNVTADPIPEGDPVNDSDTAIVTMNAPAVQIVKTPDQSVNPGGTAAFTLTVTNPGDVSLDNVMVTDAMCDAAPVLQSGDIGVDGILTTTETWIYTCSTANVQAGFTNTGNVTADPVGGGNAVNDSDTAAVTMNAPALSVVKSPATQAVSPGGTASFSIVVTNTGDVDLENVVLSDALEASCDTNIGNLAVSASTSPILCETTGVVAAFVNQADVTGDPVGGGDPVDDSDTAAVTLNAPAVQIVKTPDQSVSPGGTASFTLTVTNPGDVSLENVVVTDAMCDAAPVLQSGDVGSDGILTTSETWIYTCSTADVVAGFTNTGDATADPVGGGNPVNDSDTAAVTLDAPSIGVVKSPATQAVSPGGTASFSIVVTNTGNVDLENVVLSDALEASCDTNIGDLAVSASTSPILCETTNVVAAFVNQADVTGDPAGGGDPVDDSDTAAVTLAAPAISIVKSPETQAVSPGGTASFSIVVTNTGDVDLENVVLSDALEASCDTNIGNLAVSASTSPILCETTGVVAAFVNQADVTGDPAGGGAPVNDSDTAAVTLNSPAISVVKSPALQTVQPGGTASFSIVVTNTGDVDLENVVLTDDLEASCDTNIGDLAVGVSTAPILCETTDVNFGFVNRADATGDPVGGGDPVDGFGTANVSVFVDAPIPASDIWALMLLILSVMATGLYFRRQRI